MLKEMKEASNLLRGVRQEDGVISILKIPEREWCVYNSGKEAKLRNIRSLNIVEEMGKHKVEEVR